MTILDPLALLGLEFNKAYKGKHFYVFNMSYVSFTNS